ncbi:TPD1 protein homolog 1A [Lolium rigidum]|uniref:TPD1 protein homolog 1A n=1 Tax=Lolium rigidum TaxID=89674 RepID=UPI001F5DA549|nr:TPD1 protein homolog 1A [Lolium rigidum]
MSATFRGRKHYNNQNVLAAVDFDMRFTYVLAGWEGRQGLGEMRATSSAWAVVLLLAALVPVSLASASDHAGFSPTRAPPLAAPMPAPSAAPPHPALPRAVLPRKVLRPAVAGTVRPHRVDDGCAGADDIAIYQGRGTTLPSGVPAYTVDVMNRCSAGDCAIAGIHVRCGWFSSVTLVDPRKFRRLARDDCLINDGQPLLAGETLSFEYANSFPYPLAVAVATCVDPAAATSP